MLQREVSDLADITGLADMPGLLATLAARTGGLLDFADIARTADLPQTTLKRHMALLEMTFLVHRVPAWTPNLGRRLIKSPKMIVVDSGMGAHLLDAESARLRADPPSPGDCSSRDGLVVRVEVKSAASLCPRDRRGLESLRDALGDRFHRGVVLYTGAETVPLGDRLAAVSLAALCPLR